MSRKEKEVVVRLSERDLRALEYIGEMLGEEGVDKINDGEKRGSTTNRSFQPPDRAAPEMDQISIPLLSMYIGSIS